MMSASSGIMSELNSSSTNIIEDSGKISGLTSDDIILASCNSLLQQIPPYESIQTEDTHTQFVQERTPDLMVSISNMLVIYILSLSFRACSKYAI